MDRSAQALGASGSLVPQAALTAQRLCAANRDGLRRPRPPLAVVDGSITENFNQTGVRKWTAPAFDERVARTCEPMMPVSSECPRNDAC